ncbi:hypothetical protein FDECE_83 [Fusarium decemcellulare]|nr:hypothetical protein FDECE_83 [Fusarium decemcellulare]
MLPALFFFASLAAASVSNFDRASVPAICDEICTQVDELSGLCEVPDAKGRTKALFETQCFCTNDSFDVEKITSLCAACVHEWVPYYEDLNEKHKDDDDDGRDGNDRDDGDWEGDDEDRWYREGNDYSGWGDEDLAHIDRFMITCNFTSTTYSDDDWDAGSTATVQATPLRNMSQVTTTIAPAPTSDSGELTAHAPKRLDSAPPMVLNVSAATSAVLIGESTMASGLVKHHAPRRLLENGPGVQVISGARPECPSTFLEFGAGCARHGLAKREALVVVGSPRDYTVSGIAIGLAPFIIIVGSDFETIQD